MIMGPRLRKAALTAHVACSVGLLGAIIAFLALALAGLSDVDGQLIPAAYLAMELTVWWVIVPLVIAALLTGLVQSLGTSWGIFRHYWVLAKLLVTTFVAVVLSLQLRLIGYLADAAAQTPVLMSDLEDLRLSPVLHAAGGLLVLLVPLVLSLFKPSGMTRYGWRKQHERPSPRMP
jgi:hypothetical protein